MSGADIEKAVALLKEGKLVAFPTETVYGLGADAASAEALTRLYRVKGRPTDHPVIVHLASVDKLSEWTKVKDVPPIAWQLAEAFWPGPMTLILPKADHVLKACTGGQDSVGIRIPSHPLALSLLSQFGGGVAAPSANKFGKLSPTTADSVREGLGEEVAMVLDGGPCQVGIESTIISVLGATPRILRPGMITREQVQEKLGIPVEIAYKENTVKEKDAHIKAPGTLESHYAPDTAVALVPGQDLPFLISKLNNEGKTFVLLGFEDNTLRRNQTAALWVEKNADSYAQNLYQRLKDLDGHKKQFILVEAPPQDSAWDGVNDRLKRAAHGTVI